IPEEYGGSGLGVTEAAILLHEICAAGAGTTGASPIHFYVFPPMPVVKHGSAALKERYLPAIARGDCVMSFGVTEPNAGTDTSRIETRAERQGDRSVVNGRKVWNTNARQATHLLLLARPSPRDSAKPLAGLTLFFTPFDRTKITARVVVGRPIGQNQAIAHPLAHAWAKLEAAELITMKAAWLFDHGRPCGAEANTAKLLAADAGFEACDVAVQTHGGYGYAKEFHVE